jgi:5-methylcytosine-specific restriction endonuclease McrA
MLIHFVSVSRLVLLKRVVFALKFSSFLKLDLVSAPRRCLELRSRQEGVWVFDTHLDLHEDENPGEQNVQSPNFDIALSRALVLNASYQPVKLISWQKALCLWFQGKVEVLEYHSTGAARSASHSFRLPSVMRLKRYVTPRRTTRLKFSRENIYLRDNYTCQYCAKQFGAKELTLDHVVPASKFGRKDWTNVVTACRSCNHRKANRTPLGAGMPLLNEPRIPSSLPSRHTTLFAEFIQAENMPEEWRVYLGVG